MDDAFLQWLAGVLAQAPGVDQILLFREPTTEDTGLHVCWHDTGFRLAVRRWQDGKDDADFAELPELGDVGLATPPRPDAPAD